MLTNQNMLLKFTDLTHAQLIEEIMKLIIQNNELKEEFKKLKDENERLKKEIIKIKKLDEKPNIQPSILEKKPQEHSTTKKRQNNKGSKVIDLKIDRIKEIHISETELPEGANFKGFKEKTVQELIIKTETTLYRIAKYLLPDGKYIFAEEPDSVKGWSFGPELRSYIVYQNFTNRVTQQKIFEELIEFGIKISEGEINRIIEQTLELVQQEKNDLLVAGIKTKNLQVDDTGGRHKGKNCYSTVICNDFFTYIKTTAKKSRINFLELLQGNKLDYVITQETINYLKKYNFGSKINIIQNLIGKKFNDFEELDNFIKKNLFGKTLRKAIIEGALIGALIMNGFDKNTSIMSDGAGQFHLFSNILCWVHKERPLKALLPLNDIDQIEIEQIRKDFWEFYQKLKIYKLNPDLNKKLFLTNEFDKIFSKITTELPLSLILKSIRDDKEKLLRILDDSTVPLHNNLSEINIREMVIKRKISAGTKSDKGRDSRDAFISLNKTCKKLGIPFWQYLNDRVAKRNQIIYLPEFILQKHYLSLRN